MQKILNWAVFKGNRRITQRHTSIIIRQPETYETAV